MVVFLALAGFLVAVAAGFLLAAFFFVRVVDLVCLAAAACFALVVDFLLVFCVFFFGAALVTLEAVLLVRAVLVRAAALVLVDVREEEDASASFTVKERFSTPTGIYSILYRTCRLQPPLFHKKLPQLKPLHPMLQCTLMTQDRALDILKTGASVFLTGEPGAGKSHVINQYTAWLEAAGIPVAITASTGIAATHIGGMTLHSWSAIGTRDELSERDLDAITSKEYVVKRLKKTAVLIIDEISMLDGYVLDMVERILQAARGNREPFGGLQVVFVGDFFQLPPINRHNEAPHYAFMAKSWHRVAPLVCYLSEQYRHDDELLTELLTAIRSNTVEESHYTLLEEQQSIGYEDIEPTRLFTHNAAVDSLNQEQLKALPGKMRRYTMKKTGNKLLTDGLIRSCLSPESLILCEDAMVMCTKNNFEAGYANGTLGRIVSFETGTGFPQILTTAGETITIKPATWSIVDHGKPIAEITQIPLRLAWAITVHKSQGMSLDAVEMDLQNAFVFGQGYVALSRVRTLTGLKVLGMNPNALQVDPQIVTYDATLRTQSTAAVEQFDEMEESEIEEMHRAFALARGKQLPSKDQVTNVPRERSTPKSTQAITHDELLRCMDIDAVAKARKLTTGTIVQHIEYLMETSALDYTTLEKLLPQQSVLEETKAKLFPIMDEYGIEKLKPIHEACDGTYDYIYLRLIRLLYQYDTGRG